MRIFIAIILAASMSGCGSFARMAAYTTGYTKVCVDGITYLQFPSGSSVQVDKDGKPALCK